jgi:ribosomal-protein-alanine N-acetyltransferase
MNESSWQPRILETDRLTVRPVSEEDAPSIFDYGKDPKVSQYCLWKPHQSLQDSVDFIEGYALSHYKEGVPEPMAIVEKKSQRMIGTVGCFWKTKKSHCMEIAYVIHPDFWGQGITSEAGKAVIDYCFKLFKVERMQSVHKAPNLASGKVMQKLGMKHEGELRNRLLDRGQYWDMTQYSVLHSEWLELNRSETGFVRRARFGDEEGIHEAHMRSIKEVCSKDYREDQIAAWAGRKFSADGRKKSILEHDQWVVEKNGKIEGYGHLVLNHKESSAEVYGLYFTPEVQGQGFGREMFSYMKELCQLEGIKGLKLSSTVTSKKFYEKVGFRQFGADDQTIINGVPIEGHPMKLTLN